MFGNALLKVLEEAILFLQIAKDSLAECCGINRPHFGVERRCVDSFSGVVIKSYGIVSFFDASFFMSKDHMFRRVDVSKLVFDLIDASSEFVDLDIRDGGEYGLFSESFGGEELKLTSADVDTLVLALLLKSYRLVSEFRRGGV